MRYLTLFYKLINILTFFHFFYICYFLINMISLINSSLKKNDFSTFIILVFYLNVYLFKLIGLFLFDLHKRKPLTIDRFFKRIKTSKAGSSSSISNINI